MAEPISAPSNNTRFIEHPDDFSSERRVTLAQVVNDFLNGRVSGSHSRHLSHMRHCGDGATVDATRDPFCVPGNPAYSFAGSGNSDIAMDIGSLLVQLISGAAGGNIVGDRLKPISLGIWGNTLSGIVGGGVGGQILNTAFGTSRIVAATGVDAGIIISEIASGGIGGAALAVLVGVLRRCFPGSPVA
ncbi:MAG: hypothetical protein ACM31O_18585 [Bacteroidota bacterium]